MEKDHLEVIRLVISDDHSLDSEIRLFFVETDNPDLLLALFIAKPGILAELVKRLTIESGK